MEIDFPRTPEDRLVAWKSEGPSPTPTLPLASHVSLGKTPSLSEPLLLLSGNECVTSGNGKCPLQLRHYVPWL